MQIAPEELFSGHPLLWSTANDVIKSVSLCFLTTYVRYHIKNESSLFASLYFLYPFSVSFSFSFLLPLKCYLLCLFNGVDLVFRWPAVYFSVCLCVFLLVCSVWSIASLWLSILLCWSTDCELILFLISRILDSQEHAVEIYLAPDAVCLATAVLMLSGIFEHKGRKSFLSHLCVILLHVQWPGCPRD